MAPACGGGPSNWNCLLETMEPTLPLLSVKTPSFRDKARVPEFLQEVSAGDRVALALQEEEVLEEEEAFEEEAFLVVGAKVVVTLPEVEVAVA